MIEQTRPGLSVVIPAYNSSATLEACLCALCSYADARTEIIVVDDGSTDSSAEICERYGVKALRLPANCGRGPARNRGAEQARSERILFVDSDVVVHPDTLEKVHRIFDSTLAPIAFFGSYDDRSQPLGLVTDYRNLLHHFTHQRAAASASHFWTGLGAIQRAAFLEVGGLCESKWARQIEEVEFGARLTRAGHGIRVVRDIQASHLKAYSLVSMIKSDLLERALPWSILMLERKLARNPFVMSLPQSLSALGALLATLGLATAPWTGATGLALSLAGLLLFALANHRLWSFLAQKRGVPFMLRCLPLHMIHSLCAALGLAAALGLFSSRGIASVFGRKSPISRPQANSLPRGSRAVIETEVCDTPSC